MTTDFSTFTNAGLQNITYHNKNSMSDYGVLIAGETITSGLAAKSITEDIPRRDGKLDISDLGGLKFGVRTLIYQFKLFAADRESLKAKEAEIISWLKSDGDKQLFDSDYAETVEETITNNGITQTVTTTVPWAFTNCNFKAFEVEEGDKLAEGEYEYVKVAFECDPYLTKQGTFKTRVLKFTDVIAANTSATIAVTDNACTVTKSDGTAQAVTLPNTARKYRLVAYSGNAPTVTLNGSTLALDTVFTLPASATIVIASAGYAYVELWNDTREVKL